MVPVYFRMLIVSYSSALCLQHLVHCFGGVAVVDFRSTLQHEACAKGILKM
jgi:hypothetical protein